MRALAKDEALTVAIRVCAWCHHYLGHAYWIGAQAVTGQPVVVTHGVCDRCEGTILRRVLTWAAWILVAGTVVLVCGRLAGAW